MKRYFMNNWYIKWQLDISKVNLDIMKTWIGKEITEIMGYEDDVLIDMIYNMLALDEVILSILLFMSRKLIPSIFKSH